MIAAQKASTGSIRSRQAANSTAADADDGHEPPSVDLESGAGHLGGLRGMRATIVRFAQRHHVTPDPPEPE